MVTGDDPLGLHLVDRGEGEIGVDRTGPIPSEQREVLHLAGFAGFDHDSAAGSRPRADEMMMNAPRGQQRRHHRHLPAAAPVGKDDDRHSGGHGGRRLGTNRVETLPHASRPLRRWKQQRNRLGHEAGLGELFDPRALGVGDHGRLQPQQPTLSRLAVEEIPLTPDRGNHRRDDLLADRVERRIGDLREELLEVVGQQLRPIGEHRQRRVVAHRTDWLGAIGGHGGEDHLEILKRVSERPLELDEARVLTGYSRRPPGIEGMGMEVDRAFRQPFGGLNRPTLGDLNDTGRVGQRVEPDLVSRDPFPPRLR